MRKIKEPLKQYIFRYVDGMWRDVRDYNYLLSDFFTEYDVNFDERIEFARFYDYDRNICIWYRAYNQAKVTVDIWPVNNIY